MEKKFRIKPYKRSIDVILLLFSSSMMDVMEQYTMYIIHFRARNVAINKLMIYPFFSFFLQIIIIIIKDGKLKKMQMYKKKVEKKK